MFKQNITTYFLFFMLPPSSFIKRPPPFSSILSSCKFNDVKVVWRAEAIKRDSLPFQNTSFDAELKLAILINLTQFHLGDPFNFNP